MKRFVPVLAGFVTLAVVPGDSEAQRTATQVRPLTILPQRVLAKRAIPTAHKIRRINFSLNNKPDVDLRPTIKNHALQVKNQGSRNTCSVFAVNFCHEYLWATQKNFGMGADFSEEYLNYVKNVACNIKKDGGFFSQIDKGYQAWGVYMTGLVPYKSSYDSNYKVPTAYMDVAKKWDRAKADFIKAWNPNMGASAAQIAKACSYLDQGVPVAGGFLWPNSLQFEPKGGLSVFKTPANKNQVFDGHSVALVGYKKSNLFPGGGYFIIRNSWGSGWGEDGYAYMPFEYVSKYANDLLAYHF